MPDDADWLLPWNGGCRCGQTRLRISAPPLLTMACHCRGCQRMSASAFSLSIAVPTDGFAVTTGEPVLGGAGRDMHHFCPSCLSWLFTRVPGMDWFVNVRATALDDPSWFVPLVETYTSTALPWAATGAVHRFPEFPELSAFEGFVAEFREAGIRPDRAVTSRS